MNDPKTELPLSEDAKGIPVRWGSSFAERFWRSVREADDGCWEWQRAKFAGTGYGAIWVDGKVQRAHRIAWELTQGPIPDELIVIHSCDNRACVRPEHLRLGTHAENTADMDARRRRRNGKVKLTDAQVAEIRERHAAGESQMALGREFGVSNVHVHHIVHGTRRAVA